MGNESRKPPGEDDPTDQHEALDYDGTSTVQLDDTYRFRVVAMSENSAGGIDRDDLGRPRWKWITEGPAPAGETDKTFDHLKALDHDALTVKDSAARTCQERREPHWARSKYLFSGLLKCGKCGGNFVVCNAQSYACGNHVNGGPCDSDVIIKRSVIEAGLLAGIQRDVLAPEIEAEVCRRAMKLAKAKKAPEDRNNAIGKLRGEIRNLTEAIAGGALRSSPALGTRLQDAERALARLEWEVAQPARGSVAQLIPRLTSDYRALVRDLAETLTDINVQRARAELRKLLGEVRVVATEDTVELWSTQSAEQALMRVAGAPQQICVVAGACYALSLSYPQRVRVK